jgi:hypothetical protein
MTQSRRRLAWVMPTNQAPTLQDGSVGEVGLVVIQLREILSQGLRVTEDVNRGLEGFISVVVTSNIAE